MQDRGTQELRANSRVVASVPCEVLSSGASFPAFLLNLSLRGALIASRRSLPKNSPISIFIGQSELGAPIVLTGEVVRVSRGFDDSRQETFRCGVRFHSLPAGFLAIFKKLLAENRGVQRS